MITLPFGKRVSWESTNAPWTLQPWEISKRTDESARKSSMNGVEANFILALSPARSLIEVYAGDKKVLHIIGHRPNRLSMTFQFRNTLDVRAPEENG